MALRPTSDAFRALARSSPWRWSTVEALVERDEVEHAWIRRPDRLYWNALFDPVELAEGVEVAAVAEVEHHGRPAWEARARPTPDYEPRCDCCALLSGNGDLDQQPWVPTADSVIRLDLQTGICVRVRHVGSGWVGQEADVRILSVDRPMDDELFRRPTGFGRFRSRRRP